MNIPKWVSCGLYKKSGSGEIRFDGVIMIRNDQEWLGWLVEISMSHQIRWDILREHNWGVPSVHIKFIYYVTYIVQYLIVLQG